MSTSHGYRIRVAVLTQFNECLYEDSLNEGPASQMTLLDLIKNLANLDPDLTIYAKKPWQPSSEAVATLPDPDENPVPPELEAQDFRYFLEVSVATEFAKGWRSTKLLPPSSKALCERLIQYAINDA